MVNIENNKVPKIFFYCVSVISMSMMAFEISLVRLLSVMLSYHYVYGITSLALLGSGIGAFVVQYRDKKSEIEKDSGENHILYKRLSLRLSLASAAMILSVLLIVQMGRFNIDNIFIYGILLCLPFYFQGMFLSSIFRGFSSYSSRLYFADLIGAALGCALIVFVLNRFNDIESVALFSGVIALFSLLFLIKYKVGKSALTAIFATIALFVCFIGINVLSPSAFDIPIGVNSDKEIYDSLNRFDGRIVETRWSAFGRTDLVKYESIPGQMDIYLDGTAGSPMFAFNGNLESPNEEIEGLRTFPGYFPFQFIKDDEKEKSLVIGAGGGRDILIALQGGIKKVTGIEVNPDLVNIVKNHEDYNGGLYTSFDMVELVVDEGRSFLRSHDMGKYSVIQLTLPRTNTSRSREGYSLTENYLFTMNSLGEYMDMLSEGGHLIVVANDDVEVLKLLSLTLYLNKERGIDEQETMKSLYILGAAPNPVFVLRNGSFEVEEIEDIYMGAMSWDGYNPQTSYFPGSGFGKQMNPVLYAVSQGQMSADELLEMVGEFGYDISPVTDNSPFFYKVEKGLPKSIKMVLIFSFMMIGAVALMLAAMKSEAGKSSLGLARRYRYFTVFALLGAGFMLVEISMVQKFVFFLGRPVVSLTVILFAVLLGTGVGSMISGKTYKNGEFKSVYIAAISIAILLLIYNFALLPLMFQHLLGTAMMFRTFLSILVLLPLSMLMGMPFPLMIRRLGDDLDGGTFIPWMWGVNAGASVLGSALAMAIAMALGFNEAVIVGALCYLTIGVISYCCRESKQ